MIQNRYWETGKHRHQFTLQMSKLAAAIVSYLQSWISPLFETRWNWFYIRLLHAVFDFVLLFKGSICERSIVFDELKFWVSSIKFDYRTQSESNEPSEFDWVPLIDYAGLIFMISQILVCQGFYIINFRCFILRMTWVIITLPVYSLRWFMSQVPYFDKIILNLMKITGYWPPTNYPYSEC